MPGAQVPQTCSGLLGKSRAYGSSVYSEYQQQALALLADEPQPDTPFLRLAPLLFKTFDLGQQFADRKAAILANADPAYREWVNRVLKENRYSPPQ